MSETVILALIALVGSVLFLITATVLVKMVLKARPTCFRLKTENGLVEVSFDTKADEE